MRRNFVMAIAVAAKVAATAGKMAAIISLTIPHTATIAYAKYDLPPPYVSRALGAVLIPINHASRHRYQIPPRLHGVYVLAVSPNGVAARQGIRPGDVLATVRSHPIMVPADVDRLVWGALAVHVTDFLFGVARGSTIIDVDTNISVNNFNQTINLTNINNWTSIDNHSDWAQIVNDYGSNISNSISDNSYRSDTVINNSGIPEPGQNFDGTSRDGSAGASVPEPGQNFDGTNRDNSAGEDMPEPGQNLDGSKRDSSPGEDVPEPGQNLDTSGSSNDDTPEDDTSDADRSGNDAGSTDTDDGDSDDSNDIADNDTNSDNGSDEGTSADNGDSNGSDDNATNDDADSDSSGEDSSDGDSGELVPSGSE